MPIKPKSAPCKVKRTAPGLYQCGEPECRQQFTVTVGTVFERSKIPLSKWLAALFLLVSSKKGISAHQMHRMLGVSYKSTWFMMHRLREAMRTGALSPLGGDGKTVEVDETFIGFLEGQPKKFRSGYQAHRIPFLPLWSVVARPVATTSIAPRLPTLSQL